MSYVLSGSRYIGTGALPPPVAGYDLVDTTTGNAYFANATATAWNLVGNINNVNLGLLALTGGTMNGAITGATGWAPNDSPNFTTSIKLDGVNLATTLDLTTKANDILNGIAPKITEAVATTSASLNVKANIALAKGVLTFTQGYGTSDGVHPNPPQTIPLPTYPDGSSAAEADCVWIVSVVSQESNVSMSNLRFSTGTASSWANVDSNLVDPNAVRTFCVTQYDGSSSYTTKVVYMIIGVRL